VSLREKLLARLLAAADFVSGAELSGALGVSRCAVWKHIEALRDEGYEIAGSPRRGYRLLKVPDALYPPLFSPLVRGKFGRPYHFYPVVSSTNDVAKELARQGAPEGALVVAEEQTGGRGRLGRIVRLRPRPIAHQSGPGDRQCHNACPKYFHHDESFAGTWTTLL